MTPDQAHGLITQERIRQVEVEGWDDAHDDAHSDGSLLRVAVLYYQNAGFQKWAGEPVPLALRDDGAPEGFPWDREWWKPKTPLRDLVRAGALCVAEVERRMRAGRRRAKEPLRYGSEIVPAVGPVEHKLSLIVAALCTLDAPQQTSSV